MLRNKRLLLSSLLLLVSSALFAGDKNSEPISGLNMDDFKSATKTNKTESEWESNPFVKYGDPMQAKQMMLYGIVFSKHDSMALINSEIVKVGDRVGESTVVAIERQKVILRNDDGLFQISLRSIANDKN